ncbi:unnamed protein product [Symbiodinium pilosum]|uniref:Uncharacterized protein n=1 Tax=Symbiodinium pilosum TaxID=2952 RepID=A0A812WSG0_SYMPI|nr:unnamed protein product [Symbiodinium pilosum]
MRSQGNSAASTVRSNTAADQRRRQRRQGFPALGISVLESAVSAVQGQTDLPDIKFRGNAVGEQRSELDLQTSLLKGGTKEQAQILAIAHGLQEGIEDLLAGRVFHPGADKDEVEWDSSSAESDSSSTLPPTSPTESKKVVQEERPEAQPAEAEPSSPLPAKMKKALAGMPGWMQGEVESGDEQDSSNEDGSARADHSDDDSVDGFLNINYHDIDDIVQETDDSKIEQQVNAGRAATNRIMYEWKEMARVRLTEELNEWFQERKAKGGTEVAELDGTEAESNQTMVSQGEGIREVKSGIEKKEMALFSTISCPSIEVLPRLSAKVRHPH